MLQEVTSTISKEENEWNISWKDCERFQAIYFIYECQWTNGKELQSSNSLGYSVANMLVSVHSCELRLKDETISEISILINSIYTSQNNVFSCARTRILSEAHENKWWLKRTSIWSAQISTQNDQSSPYEITLPHVYANVLFSHPS